jgi:hypothetical protein
MLKGALGFGRSRSRLTWGEQLTSQRVENLSVQCGEP